MSKRYVKLFEAGALVRVNREDHLVALPAGLDLAKIVHDKVGALEPETLGVMRGLEAQDTRARALTREDTSRRVFNDDALGDVHTAQLGTLFVWLRVGLALVDVI